MAIRAVSKRSQDPDTLERLRKMREKYKLGEYASKSKAARRTGGRKKVRARAYVENAAWKRGPAPPQTWDDDP